MTAVVDTSVLIDYLRGDARARQVLERERAEAPLHASEVTRLEVLAGMRAGEEAGTYALLGTLIWHPLDQQVAEDAGALAQRWLRSHRIDAADLAIAATALLVGGRLLTRNVRHFPMLPNLHAPY